MRNTRKMKVLGFILIWLTLPFAFINETVALIILGMGIAYFTVGVVIAFIILIREMPHIPTEYGDAYQEYLRIKEEVATKDKE